MNTTTISGYVKQVQERAVGDKNVMNFSVAVYGPKNQQTQKSPVDYFNVTYWGSLPIHDGDKVTVTGKLRQETWETNEGQKRSKIVVLASEVGMLQRATGQANQAHGGQESRQAVASNYQQPQPQPQPVQEEQAPPANVPF